jgi:hypothetical protein
VFTLYSTTEFLKMDLHGPKYVEELLEKLIYNSSAFGWFNCKYLHSATIGMWTLHFVDDCTHQDTSHGSIYLMHCIRFHFHFYLFT